MPTNGGTEGKDAGSVRIEIHAVEDWWLDGHAWAVVTLEEKVLLLVSRSANERSGIDHQALNEALAKAGPPMS